MKTFKRIVLSLILMTGLVAAPLAVASPVAAASPQEELCKGSGGTWDGTAKKCTNANDTTGGIENIFKTIVNVFLFLVGAISVLMIVIGGVKYVISNGDQSAVTGAKNTILYAVVGLVVSLLGYAIVNFVVNAFVAPPLP